jgi:large subunit ribosomal protein L5
VPNKLDGQGNYTIGITDFTIFPEIVVENNKRQMGLDITFVTSAGTDDEAREFLKLMGMPFRRVESVPAKTTAA